jgi:hypothetical protein
VVERVLVRILVGVALCLALGAFVFVPVPTDGRGNPGPPAVAFEQPGLYRLEVALIVFYGGLLLITPAFSGLVRGKLPVEISARGARFAVQVDRPSGSGDQAIEELKRTAGRLSEDLAAANLEIKRLRNHRE